MPAMSGHCATNMHLSHATCRPILRYNPSKRSLKCSVQVHCSSGESDQQNGDAFASQITNSSSAVLSRRLALAMPASLFAASTALPAFAFRPAPPGYSLHEDKLDGYSFFYPDSWLPVTTSGNDVFYRNSVKVEENLFVDVSSPSSSKYRTVEDFGTPDEAAAKLIQQYLEEFMSTRIGVKRKAEILSASTRTGADGRLYYDIQLRAQSFASRNQLAVTQDEVNEGVVLEWDRRFLTVLGAANNRLYQLRLQVSDADYERKKDLLQLVAESFQCKDV